MWWGGGRGIDGVRYLCLSCSYTVGIKSNFPHCGNQVMWFNCVMHLVGVVLLPPSPPPPLPKNGCCVYLCYMYAGCVSREAMIISNEYRVSENVFISVFIFPSTVQYLNNTQDRAQCPPIQEAFNNLNTNFNDLTSSSPSLNIPDLRSRRQTDATTQNVLNVGYIQQCIINQGFDFVRQYDVYRCAMVLHVCLAMRCILTLRL